MPRRHDASLSTHPATFASEPLLEVSLFGCYVGPQGAATAVSNTVIRAMFEGRTTGIETGGARQQNKTERQKRYFSSSSFKTLAKRGEVSGKEDLKTNTKTSDERD